jgi:hypothetical protein
MPTKNKKKPQTIISLHAENVKRLKAVRIKPTGALVVIGGKNDQGKTSCLDAIEYAFHGRGSVCEEPIRRGTKKARIICKMQDYTVIRKFTKSGSQIEVIANDTDEPLRSPQAVLDALAGDFTFDPVAFSRAKPAEQVEVLRSLIGVDFSHLDGARAKYYEERANQNRRLKESKAKLATMERFEDAPDSPVDVSELMAERKRLEAENQANEDKRESRQAKEAAGKLLSEDKDELETMIAECREEITRLEAALKDQEKQLADKKAEIKKHFEIVKAARAEVEALEDNDLSEIDEQIARSGEVNRQVDANQAIANLEAHIEHTEDSVSTYTGKIEEIDEQKAAAIAEAKLPVDGLTFDEHGVRYHGTILSECGSASRTKVSLAIGIAQHPDLGVILIRDGSLLDKDSMKVVADMAAENDFQVWIEVVSEDEQCSVIIEDGEVKADEDESDE